VYPPAFGLQSRRDPSPSGQMSPGTRQSRDRAPDRTTVKLSSGAGAQEPGCNSRSNREQSRCAKLRSSRNERAFNIPGSEAEAEGVCTTHCRHTASVPGTAFTESTRGRPPDRVLGRATHARTAI
jgi:hypothetical protein